MYLSHIRKSERFLGCSFEHYTFSYADGHFPQKMGSICPMFSTCCGESLWLLVSLGLSRLLYYRRNIISSITEDVRSLGLLTTTGRWASFPFMAWVSLCLKTSEHLCHTSFKISKDQLFSPVRMSESQPCTTEDLQRLCCMTCFCVHAPLDTGPPHFLSLHIRLLPFSTVPVGEEMCFSFYPPGLSLRDPVKLDR